MNDVEIDRSDTQQRSPLLQDRMFQSLMPVYEHYHDVRATFISETWVLLTFPPR